MFVLGFHQSQQSWSIKEQIYIELFKIQSKYYQFL